jgi:hypothetical protein
MTRLYHYTCSHSVSKIRALGQLVGNPHPWMPEVGPLIHLTDLEHPERLGLGLTSRIITCDRTEWRCVVETEAAQHWPRFARTIPRRVREALEAAPGALPMHWYVATEPLPVQEMARVPR